MHTWEQRLKPTSQVGHTANAVLVSFVAFARNAKFAYGLRSLILIFPLPLENSGRKMDCVCAVRRRRLMRENESELEIRRGCRRPGEMKRRRG